MENIKINIFKNKSWCLEAMCKFKQSTDRFIGIKNGDRLCLVPDGRFYVYFPKLENETREAYFQRFIDHGNKFFINIDENQKTAIDLIGLFIVESKKIYLEEYNLFDLFFDKDSDLFFNGIIYKKNNCWFLCFDS